MANGIIFMLFLLVSVPLCAAAAMVALPQTGQSACYSLAGATVPCAGTDQDGATQMGAPWPVPRFTDNLDGTVTDNLTGLIWLQDAHCPDIQPAGGSTWPDALAAAGLHSGQCGLTGVSPAGTWRLPNVNELESLIDISQSGPPLPVGHPFTITPADLDWYWTSTVTGVYPGNAEGVHMYLGTVRGDVRTHLKHVWPVSGGANKIARTGQTTCWDLAGNPAADCSGINVGADGGLKIGAVWTIPRFVDNNDGTLTDKLTDLIWLKKADCFGNKETQGEAITAVRALASSTCSLIDVSVPVDWRLPERNEMRSMVNYGQPDGALWLGAQGFINPHSGWYWSSSSYPIFPGTIDKWMIKTEGGTWLTSELLPGESKFFLPVRGPQKIQPIIFNSATKTFGDAPVNLNTLVTGVGSGNPVTFTVINGPGELSGTNSATLTIKGAGSIAVRASQAGNATFLAAPDTQQTIVVAKATPTVTWGTPAAVVAGTALSTTQLNATVIVPGSFAYSPAIGSVTVAGTQTLSATFTPTDAANYSSATATTQLTVTNIPIETFLVTGVATGNGSVTCTSPVNSGASSVCTITWDAGYHLLALTDNGAGRLSAFSGSTLTIAGVTGDHVVAAVFARPSGILNPVEGMTAPDLSDALAVLRIVTNASTATPADIARADIAPLGTDGHPMGDGILDVYDVIGVFRMRLGL